MRILRTLKRIILLENSPLPKFHVYGLFMFAVIAIAAAPFLPVMDDDGSSDYELNVDGLYNDSMTIEVPDEDQIESETEIIVAYRDLDLASVRLFNNTFLDGANTDETPDYEWLTYTVHENETLTKIFKTLNISQATLQKILQVDVKNVLVALRIGQEIDFLIDENGILRSLSVPLKNSKQEILFVRTPEKKYVSYIDPIGTHKTADIADIINPRTDYKPSKIENNESTIVANNHQQSNLVQGSIEDIFAKTSESLTKDQIKAEKEKQEKLAQQRNKELLAAKQKHEEQNGNQTTSDKGIRKDSTVIFGKIVVGSFIIDGQNAGLNKKHIRKISDIFRGKIDFRRDFHKGDTFRVLFDRLSSDDKAKILAISFNIAGKNKNMFFSDSDGRYYDEIGMSTASTSKFLRVPIKVKNLKISSPFSPSRYHPTLKRYRAHKGTDYPCPMNTPVFSTASGTVIKIGHQFPGAGHYVVVDHGNKIHTLYLHLNKIVAKEGQKLKQGQVLGLAGMSGGISTGPHIHYQLEINGHAVDSTNSGLPIYNPSKSTSSTNKNFQAKVRVYKQKLNIK